MYNLNGQIVSNIRNNNGVLEYQDAETGKWKKLENCDNDHGSQVENKR